MKVVHFFTVALSLFFIGCTTVVSGTGQHGEAMVIGSVKTSSGDAVANHPVAVAHSQYSGEKSRRVSYDDFKIDTVMTDAKGFFIATVPANGSYTISSRTDTTLLYKPNMEVKSENLAMGDLTLEKGDSLSIYPWWSSDGVVDTFTLFGTDWVFKVSDNTISSIMVPKGEIKFILSNSAGYDTIPINSSIDTSIGDTTGWNSSNGLFMMVDSSLVGVMVGLNLVDRVFNNVYTVDWGSGSVDTIEAGDSLIYDVVNHKYSGEGRFSVVVSEFEIDSMLSSSMWKLVRSDSKEIIINPSITGSFSIDTIKQDGNVIISLLQPKLSSAYTVEWGDTNRDTVMSFDTITMHNNLSHKYTTTGEFIIVVNDFANGIVHGGYTKSDTQTVAIDTISISKVVDLFTITDTIFVNDVFALNLISMDSSLLYTVNWGDSSLVDTIFNTTATHSYQSIGIYDITVNEYEKSLSDTVSEWAFIRSDVDQVNVR